MAAIQPQGSRAGLITALVIFVILFVTAFIFALLFKSDLNRAQENLNNKDKTYAEIISTADLGNSDIQALKEASKDYGGAKAVSVAIAQRNDIAKLISPVAYTQSKAAATAAINQANETLKAATPAITFQPTEPLTSIVTTLASAIATREQQIADLKKLVEAAQKKEAASGAAYQEQMSKTGQTIEQIRQGSAAELATAEAAGKTKEQTLADFQAKQEEERKAATAAAEALNKTIEGQTARIKELETLLEKFKVRLAGRQNVNTATVRVADGHILRIPGNGIVYIDLGAGEQVTPGLTFTVYDKAEGVPPLGDGLDESKMPAGKGSIEVVRVGSTSSECRVIKTTPGTVFSEGDLLVNLVYDPNTKYSFVVHGNFDIDRDGRSSPGDAEIVKRLITQWGGKVTDKVTIDTDFVVLGTEPVLPSFTADDLIDPSKAKIMQDATAALDAYNAVRNQAADLHIPVMNQNRFLYYVGYFDQAKR